jgi:hypothetical protein
MPHCVRLPDTDNIYCGELVVVKTCGTPFNALQARTFSGMPFLLNQWD